MSFEDLTMDEVNGTASVPDGRPDREPSVFLGVLLFLVSATCVAGNVLTILAFRARENVQLRRRTSNFLVLSLSCADLMIGLTGLPFAALGHSLGRWPLGEKACLASAYFSVLGVAGGMYTLAAISADRLLLVSLEYADYLRRQSLRNIRIQIAGTWVVAAVVATTEAVIWAAGGAREAERAIDYEAECRSPVRTDPRFAVSAGLVLFVLPFLVMLVCSLRFVVLLRRRLRRRLVPEVGAAAGSRLTASTGDREPAMRGNGDRRPGSSTSDTPVDAPSTTADSHTTTGGANQPASSTGVANHPANPTSGSARSQAPQRSSSMQNRYMKPAVRLAILLGVFAFCSLPYPIFVLVADTRCPDCGAQVAARNHLSNLLLANSALNPFLYAIMHRQIRQYHVKRFRAIFCRRKVAL